MTRVTRSNLACLLCVLFCNSLQAQHFKNKAALGRVSKTGFYLIDITPELTSYVKTDFSDLRIMDDSNRQTPYVIENFGTAKTSTSSEYLEILKNDITDSGKSVLILLNRKRGKIENFSLLIRNTSVSRLANISGSDDMQHWYSISENMLLLDDHSADSDKYTCVMGFPVSTYRFFKLIIYNGKNDPLNIISAQIYHFNEEGPHQHKEVSSMIDNPNSRFTQKDSSDGFSYINVHDTFAFHKCNVFLSAKAPAFFKREMTILLPYQSTFSFTYSSSSLPMFSFPVFKAKDWIMKIYNGDNPPVKVEDISTKQVHKQIYAWLDSGRAYHLLMNDSAATAPVYDLQDYSDSINHYVGELRYSNIESIALPVAAPAKSIFKQPVLWAIVIAILVGLLFFTTKLTKEVAKKE